MEIDDPEVYLYDTFTQAQLLAIADHNNIAISRSKRKMQIARAIVEGTDGAYEVPKEIPLAKSCSISAVKSLSGKNMKRYRQEETGRMLKQYEDNLSEEELSDNETYKRLVKKRDMYHAKPSEKIAVYSERNLYWDAIGNLSRGYSFIDREEAEKWLQLKGVRVATPQEVSTHFDL